MKNAVFVDLSNFYSSCLKSKIVEPGVMRSYFIEWLDFDRLTNYLTGEWSPTWVFYSIGKTGSSDFRITNTYQDTMIKRINRQKGVTARDVDIPGEQRETSTFKCSKCGEENTAETVGEKGVDASLTVHLFETMDTWDTAFLLSGDADFVPVVSTLRRMGKNIITVSSQNTSDALIRESYDFMNLDGGFLEFDLLGYRIFKKDGFIEKWLSKPESMSNNENPVDLYYSISVSHNENFISIEEALKIIERSAVDSSELQFRLTIGSHNINDKKEKEKVIMEFFNNENLRASYSARNWFVITLPTLPFLGIIRHQQEFFTCNGNITSNRNMYLVKYS